MICPTCNIQMHHLNKGGGVSGCDTYNTYDYVRCPTCFNTAIEFYHTQFIGIIPEGINPNDLIFPIPDFNINSVIKMKD